MTGGRGDTVALAKVLANTAREMQALAASAGAIDAAMGDLIAAAATPSAGAARPCPVVLQDVDRLRQTAECLYILLANLARHQVGGGHVSARLAGERVYLEGVRRGCLGL